MKKLWFASLFLLLLLSCDTPKKEKTLNISNSTDNHMKKISEKSKKIKNYVNNNIVIAHRGSTYWTPEETEPAYRWARNIGADYLELDLQMTKDSILVALHDDTLERTSNVSEVFPKIKNPTTNDFTLKQLRSLDFGSWFNKKNPKRARKNFVNSKILTLKDVLKIAEGYQIKKLNGEPVKEIINHKWTGKYVYEVDKSDNKNRPGVYAETKKLHLEKLLAKELKEYGWLITNKPKNIETFKNKVSIANTNARFILQSFYPQSILELNKYLHGVPKCLLLWRQDLGADLKTELQKSIEFCIKNDVQIIGTSIAGAPNNYEELTAEWMTDLFQKEGLLIHPYTFDTENDFKNYANRVDGVFTNRADLALIYYNRLSINNSIKILEQLGY